MSIEDFDRLQYIPWDLEGHTQVQGFTHAQEGPILPILDDFEALHKQVMKAKTDFLNYLLEH